MDSSGIGVVIGRLKKIQNRDGKVCITNVNKRVDKVFTLSGLYKIITVIEILMKRLKVFNGGVKKMEENKVCIEFESRSQMRVLQELLYLLLFLN